MHIYIVTIGCCTMWDSLSALLYRKNTQDLGTASLVYPQYNALYSESVVILHTASEWEAEAVAPQVNTDFERFLSDIFPFGIGHNQV